MAIDYRQGEVDVETPQQRMRKRPAPRAPQRARYSSAAVRGHRKRGSDALIVVEDGRVAYTF
jgi:hypothetical protein